MPVDIFLNSQLVKKLRLGKGFTQEELGDRSGVGQPVISRAENNRAVKFENAQAIASFFDMSLEELQATASQGDKIVESAKSVDHVASRLRRRPDLSPWLDNVITILDSGNVDAEVGLKANIQFFLLGLEQIESRTVGTSNKKRRIKSPG